MAAGRDPLRDEGRACHRGLGACAVPSRLDEYPGMFQGFLALTGVLPPARDAMATLGGTISSTVADGKTFGEAGGGAG